MLLTSLHRAVHKGCREKKRPTGGKKEKARPMSFSEGSLVSSRGNRLGKHKAAVFKVEDFGRRKANFSNPSPFAQRAAITVPQIPLC